MSSKHMIESMVAYVHAHVYVHVYTISPLIVFLVVLFRLVTPFFNQFPVLLCVSPGNLSHSFFHISFTSSWPWPHPLISERFIVRPSDQRALLQTESCLKCQKWRWKECFLDPFVQESRTMAHLTLTRVFYSQLNSHHALSPSAWHPPTSPCPTLSTSAEPIFKTNCTNW